MISFELNNKDDLKPVSPNGLLSFKIASKQQTTSQLVEARIRTQSRSGAAYQPDNTIDWFELMEELNSSQASTFASIAFTKLSLLIGETNGVASVDLSNAEFGVDRKSIILNNLCFTHECGTVEEFDI